MGNENVSNEEFVSQYVLLKTLNCEVCGHDFSEYIIRSQKLRFVSSDDDLHPNYRDVEPLFYDVIICGHCTYAAMSMFFNKVSSTQRNTLRKELAKLKTPEYTLNKVRTYESAIKRFDAALLTANLKGAKNGEIGYIYTKIAWLTRLSGNDASYKFYAARALKELEAAYQKEDFPICQMDDTTFEYLMAYFSYAVGKSEEAVKLLGRIITNSAASGRIKDKARNLKEIIKTD